MLLSACRRCLPPLPPGAGRPPPAVPPACPCYQVVCRRLPEEVARVTQTLQLDVEELFANLLDWDTPKPAPKTEQQAGAQPAAQQQGEQQEQQQGQQGQQQRGTAASGEQQPGAGDSKKLCGNVESDQPGRLQAGGNQLWRLNEVALCCKPLTTQNLPDQTCLTIASPHTSALCTLLLQT